VKTTAPFCALGRGVRHAERNISANIVKAIDLARASPHRGRCAVVSAEKTGDTARRGDLVYAHPQDEPVWDPYSEAS
jgi:hypothetical protein